MIFSLLDYINYKNQSGRFSLETGTDIMCSSWIGSLPKPVVEYLTPGCVILHSDFDWYVSWLIMYFTKSQVSHISIYAGDGLVLHTGLGGVRLEPIENIFSKKTRLLPLAFKKPKTDFKPIKPSDLGEKENLPYPISLVAMKALYILSGRNGRFYSLKLFFDSLIIIAIISWFLSFISSSLPFIFTSIFIFILSINLVLSKLRPLPYGSKYGAPCDALVEFSNFMTPLFNPSSKWLEREVNNARA